MAYTPTNWQTGDIVSSEKLNKAESGIASAHELFVMLVNDQPVEENGSYYAVENVTAEEYAEAIEAGKIPVLRFGTAIFYSFGSHQFFHVADGVRSRTAMIDNEYMTVEFLEYELTPQEQPEPVQ